MTALSALPVRVVKFGGSLFDWPELPAALRCWLACEPPAVNVLLAGGGELADAIRRADAALGIGETAAHWLCIEILGVTAQMLAGLLPDQFDGSSPLVRLLSDLRERIESGVPATIVFDPRAFLIDDEPHLPGGTLPRNWSVTSDSIAARLAAVLCAGELVLLKSADPPPHGALAELSAAGYVDAYFPQAARELTTAIRFVNLRTAVTPGARLPEYAPPSGRSSPTPASRG
jgi:aspartokinase-like uncharacterized kinase